MNWTQLLSRHRLAHDGAITAPSSSEAARSVFERDWDRILFSTAFRRMHDKTQVFPLPDDDVVHSRLTHSLEVASVGRSLGKKVARALLATHGETLGFDFHDVGDVVAAACLAHDIGNPPFGHAGEDAIASYFQSPPGIEAIASLAPRERQDLEAFEGNAQGFRLLTRLQQEEDGGLHLTVATLAAFCKYPRECSRVVQDRARASRRKHGVFQSELPIAAAVATETGLAAWTSEDGARAWSRHPLAFLVEASDDICYSILDIEDGVRLGYVQAPEAEALLLRIASRARGFSTARLDATVEPKSRLGYLRAMAIGQMLEECAEAFVGAEAAILDGTHDASLADRIPSADDLAALQKTARVRCYNAPEVIEIELAGYEALGGLLEHFVPAVVADPARRKERPGRERKALELLRQRGVAVDEPSTYRRILRVTDFVSGMTDRHALATYRRLKGIAIPGRAG